MTVWQLPTATFCTGMATCCRPIRSYIGAGGRGGRRQGGARFERRSTAPIVYPRDGKEPSLLGFGSVRVLTKVKVRFGLTYSQVQKIWVRFLYSQF